LKRITPVLAALKKGFHLKDKKALPVFRAQDSNASMTAQKCVNKKGLKHKNSKRQVY
jgi:hypothetical protein